MSRADAYWDRVAGLSYFQDAATRAAELTALIALPAIKSEAVAAIASWNEPLFAASLVDQTAPLNLQEAALRIAQACIQDVSATDSQKMAARVLLEGWGNIRAVELAARKQLIDERHLGDDPLPVRMDLLRRDLELSIQVTSALRLRANDFQRQFWDAASRSRWVSISAPTSVGKSFIVRKWIEGLQSGKDSFTAIYVVPTRALIDEVSDELADDLPEGVDVFSLPWDARIQQSARRIFVLTQERLHLLHERMSDLSADLLFVDEAQKFDDGRRGILLQRVVDEAVRRNAGIQVIFASPLASNPEILLTKAPQTHEALLSESVTVNQNLIYANQRFGKPLEWTAELVVSGSVRALGSFRLPFRPGTNPKRLAYVAVALGGSEAANVVYVNGASEAEKVASNIFECLSQPDTINGELADLIELVQKTIHPQYLLGTTLARGVAFHYGNMPLIVREEIERLFKDGVIRFLVCTSTLLEGVNLPCQNIFVRGPKKGNSNPMTPSDFWNLAGRAGRWGKEFQGTIICVDTSQSGTWEAIPLIRERAPIVRATDQVLDNLGQFVDYLADGATVAGSRQNVEGESMFSLLGSSSDPEAHIAEARWVDLPESDLKALAQSVESAMSGVSLPEAVVRRHAGISPLSLQRLFSYFESHEDPERLLISPPESEDAAMTLVRAMSRIDDNLGGDFSAFGGRRWQLAILLVSWMRGRPLAVLVSDRVTWMLKNRPNASLASTIRAVLNDVEQIARFQAPLYLTAYADILRLARPELFVGIQSEELDFAMMLELGVSRATELSMMSLGVSRTAAVALSEHVVEDSLTPDEFLSWLRTHDLGALGIPALIVREFGALLDARPMYES